MIKIHLVKIKPAIMKWARQSLHLTEEMVVDHFRKKSKKKFDFDLEKLRKLETEIQEIRLDLLQELANLYKRPLSVFFMDAPPQEDPQPEDFRTLFSNINKQLSPETVLVIREARRMQAVASELITDLDESIDGGLRLGEYSIRDNPEEIAGLFRNKFKISFESQKKTKNTWEFFNFLRNILEETQVIVLKESFPLEDARALSLADHKPFVIIINSQDGGALGYTPKIFSLMHEFAHLLLRQSSICNDFMNHQKKVEVFCNRFAATFLVPTAEFKRSLGEITAEFKIYEIEDYIDKLKPIFKVSGEVLLGKLLSLDLIDVSLYKTTIREWEEKYKERPKKKEFFPKQNIIQKVLSRRGKAFTRLIIEAHRKEKITYDNAAEFLAIKSKHLPQLEKTLSVT